MVGKEAGYTENSILEQSALNKKDHPRVPNGRSSCAEGACCTDNSDGGYQ